MKSKREHKKTVIIGPKYQVVIPREVRKVCRDMKAGAKVRVYPLNDSTVAITLAGDDWAQTNRGGLKDLWRGGDVMKQLQQMPDELDEPS